MNELYKNIRELCERKGVSGYKMCKDIGIQPSIISDLKSGRKKGLHAETAEKIANYFGVSVNHMLNLRLHDNLDRERKGFIEGREYQKKIDDGYTFNDDWEPGELIWIPPSDKKEKSPTPDGVRLSQERIQEMLGDMTVADLEALLSDVAVEIAKKRGSV